MDLVPTHAFGVHGPIRDNILVYKHDRGANRFIFPVGNQLVTFDPKDNQMEFFDRKKYHHGHMAAMALSPSQKIVATAFCGNNVGDGAQIHIYKTLNRKKITTLSHRSKINSICFSGDSRYLICASEDSINIWSWEKEKLDYSESITGSITRLACPPQPMNITSSELLFSSTGTSHARVWIASSRHRLNNVMIMPNQAKEQKFIFQDHVWLKNIDNEDVLRFAAVMEPRKRNAGCDTINLSDISVVIYQVNGNTTSSFLDMEATIPITLDRNVQIFSIAPFRSTGFLLGGSKGTILAFDLEQERNGDATFVKSHHLRKDTDESFTSVQSLVGNEESIVAVSDAMNIYICCISNSSDQTYCNDAFRSLIPNTHHGGVVDIDCITEKPLFVCCGGMKNIISVCDYKIRRCIVSHHCNLDEPRAVAIHPSGHQLIVGFKDKIIMYHILTNRLQPFRFTSCKLCHQVKYAPLGQYFAVVLSNGIYVYATYNKPHSSSFFLLHSFMGHVGLVKSLSWANDNIFFSSGVDKNIYGWDVQRGKRIDNFNVLREFGICTYLEVFTSYQRFEAVACTSDGGIHRLDWNGTGSCQVETINSQSDDMPTTTCFNGDRSILYVGTEKGTIRCFHWNSDKDRIKCFREMSFHVSLVNNSINPAISHVRVAEDCLITTGGVDGSIILSSIQHKETKESRELKSTQPQISILNPQNDNVVLIALEDYQESNVLITELEQKIVTLNNDNEFALHSKDVLWRNEIRELTEKTNKIVEAEHLRYCELKKKYDDTIKSHVIDLDQKDSLHHLGLQENEASCEQRLRDEGMRYDALKNEMISVRNEFTKSFDDQKANYDKKIESIKSGFIGKERRLKTQICKLEDDSKESDRIFAETLDQQEEEYEMELRNIRAKSDEKLHEESLKNHKMRGNVQNLMSKKNQLSRVNDELKSKHSFTEETFRRELLYRQQIQVKLEEEKESVSCLQVQLNTKLSEIKALETEKKSLTNLKYLLETQVKNTQEEKIPLNEHIRSLNQHIKDLKHKIKSQEKLIANKDLELDQKQMKIRCQIKNMESSKETIRLMKREFTILSGLIDPSKVNQNELKDRLNVAYQKFVSDHK